MKIWKTKRTFSEAPLPTAFKNPWWALLFGYFGWKYGLKALAWTTGDGEINYVRSGRRRFAHEIWHNLKPNETHHPWYHFCVRSGVALRFWDGHVPAKCLTVAEQLLEVGDGAILDA